MNNPYDPRTGMTRGYSTPFFMNALRYQTQVPASIGQRKVNHFFGNYSPYFKDLNREPTITEQGWINLANNSFSGSRAYNEDMINEPPDDFLSNMPESRFQGAYVGRSVLTDDIEGKKKAVEDYIIAKEMYDTIFAAKTRAPSRATLLNPYSYALESQARSEKRKQTDIEF